jgi:16S rRNA (guanine527-N7)-methyltransferase
MDPVPASPDLSADRATALQLVPVSRETLARLDRFVALLLDWRQKANLISANTVPLIWTRHVADSLQLLEHALDARIWIDLGSGAGFPGMVIACALADVPGAKVHLVESTGKKTAFLQEAARITGAPVVVHTERIEKFVTVFDGRADVVTARALSPMKNLLDQSFILLKTGALGLFPKGRGVDAELTEANKYWNINFNLAPSKTDSSGRIVIVRALEKRVSYKK